jgi:hypothetical protein
MGRCSQCGRIVWVWSGETLSDGLCANCVFQKTKKKRTDIMGRVADCCNRSKLHAAWKLWDVETGLGYVPKSDNKSILEILMQKRQYPSLARKPWSYRTKYAFPEHFRG